MFFLSVEYITLIFKILYGKDAHRIYWLPKRLYPLLFAKPSLKILSARASFVSFLFAVIFSFVDNSTRTSFLCFVSSPRIFSVGNPSSWICKALMSTSTRLVFPDLVFFGRSISARSGLSFRVSKNDTRVWIGGGFAGINPRIQQGSERRRSV